MGQPMEMPGYQPIKAADLPSSGYGGYFDPTDTQPQE